VFKNSLFILQHCLFAENLKIIVVYFLIIVLYVFNNIYLLFFSYQAPWCFKVLP